MPILHRLLSGLRAVYHGKRVDRDDEEELRQYVEIAAREKMAAGMSREQALRGVRLEMGSLPAVKDRMRDVGWDGTLETMWQDTRYALRMLRKSPGFAVVAVLSLALGIGANTAVFTFLNALLLRPLPVQHPDELVELRAPGRFISFPMYHDLKAGQQVFTDIAATQGERPFRMTIPGASGGAIELDNVAIGAATGNYFSLLGIVPEAGRFFTDEEDRGPNSSEPAGSVIVLSHAFWQRQFGGDPRAIGRTILLNRSECVVVGVAPPGFTGERIGSQPDAWVPLVPFTVSNNLEGRGGTFTSEIARLKSGIGREQAEAMTTTLFRQLLKSEQIVKEVDKYRMELAPASAGIDSGVRVRYVTPLRIIMATAVLVLLIACGNVANLLIARGASRRGEIGLRLALGCSRRRLVRQLMTESLLLSAMGAAAGVGVAYLGTQWLLRMVNFGQAPIRLDLTPDLRVLLFLVAIALLTGVGFGMLPALRATRVDPSPALQNGSRGRAGGPSRQRLSRALVVAQVALSLLLVISAGLLVQSFRNLHRIDWGFRPDQVVVFELQHNPRNREPGALAGLAADIRRRVTALPGIESASVSWILLFSGMDQRSALQIPGYTPPADESAQLSFIGKNIVTTRYNSVSPAYFATVGMTLVAGRAFDDRDGAGAPLVGVINESMERKYFGAGRAVGRTFVLAEPVGKERPVEVLGVVRDAKFDNLREETMPMYWLPIAQSPKELHGLEVRTREPLSALVGPVRGAIGDLTKDIMIRRVIPLSDQVDRTLSAERLMMRLSGFVGAVALLLACVGLYGVMAYQVAQRTGEIGIRLALGATKRRIVGLVLGETASVIVAGIVVGLTLASMTTRLLTTFLYGVGSTDPGTIAVAIGLLIASAALAAYVPAHRAADVDPNVALRAN
jgi:predicted permease